MIDLERLRTCEIGFCRHLTDHETRPYGILYYNVQNPLSHDSNHAVLLCQNEALDDAIDDVISFYSARGLEPRFYPAFLPGEVERLRPRLEGRGLIFALHGLPWLIWQGPDTIRPPLHTLPDIQIRRERALSPTLVDLIHSDGPEPWSEGALRRHLASNTESLHLLVGYRGETAVAMASLNIMDGLARVDVVMTHAAHRGHGYARAVMRALLQRFVDLDLTPPYHLYLYADNPTAIRIYEEIGFAKQALPLTFWSAWLPAQGG
jgi:ribosomal protein S18 acetylase RimI-like enzyme